MTLKTKEDIAQLLKSIQENEAVANAEIPPDVPFRNVPVYTRARLQAGETAYQKKQEYKVYLDSHLGGILLLGPLEKQKEFAKLAEKIGKTITFDSLALYQRMTDPAFGMMGGTGNLTADQIALVFTEIRLLTKGELGMFRVRDPDFQWMFTQAWFDPAAFANGFRKSLFLTNGIRVTQEALLKRIYEESLAHPIPRTTIPVVILGTPSEEVAAWKEVLTHGYIEVDLAEKEATEELVTNTFITLRDTIKAKAAQ